MSLPEAQDGTTRRASTRNPRRRQRPDSETPPQQPRRKRSKLTTEAHKTTTETTTTLTTTTTTTVKSNGNGNGNGTLGKSVMNGHASHARRKSSVPPETLDVVLRTKKGGAVKRPSKSDGSTVLVRKDLTRLQAMMLTEINRHRTSTTRCDTCPARLTFCETAPAVCL